MKFGVISFPGSNCDDDLIHVLRDVMHQKVDKIWHKDYVLNGFEPSRDVLLLPGGFSYGDYMRAGAIARFSHIMPEVIKFAKNGGLVWGICNGFQILCEAHLLPGALLRNEQQTFVAKTVHIKASTINSPISHDLNEGQILRIPIAHAEGRYFADEETLNTLKKNDQILFQYCNADGEVTEASNPNGSSLNIAGICNAERNVIGMMPHPERASEQILGLQDGLPMFKSLIEARKLVSM